jgi:hypothetical protein
MNNQNENLWESTVHWTKHIDEIRGNDEDARSVSSQDVEPRALHDGGAIAQECTRL